MQGIATTKKWRLLGLVALMAAALSIAAIACSDDDSTSGDPTAEPTAEEVAVAPPGPTTFDIRAGDAGGVVTVNAFLPDDVAVRVGDTIHWTFPSPEIHTVTFLAGTEAPGVIVPIDVNAPGALQINPAVAFPAGDPAAYDGAALLSSGILPSEEPPADSFGATFTTAGEYSYLCLIHPNMTGNVAVLAADEDVAAPSVVTADGEELLQTYIEEGQAEADTLEATSIDNADGTKTWTMPMGITTEHTDVLAFIPGDLEIGAGDTVKWLNGSEAPHTATFTFDAAPPALIVPAPQPAGPPILAINQQVAEGIPATEPPVDIDSAGEYINSGILGPPGEFPSQEWSATFATAGTYSYICVLHLPNGMTGQVTVTE